MSTGKLALSVIALVLLATGVSAEGPQFNLDWYGYLKLDASRDQNPTNGHYALWVLPQTDDENEQFNMTHKQSRMGMKISADSYQGFDLAGKVEFDLYGNGADIESKTEISLRHAFFTLQTDGFQLLAGQTWDIISPMNPKTLNYNPLWACGNTGHRRPQLRLSYVTEPSTSSQFTIAAGFFRTLGWDLSTTLSLATGENANDAIDDGTDAGIPSVQGGIDYQHRFGSGASLRLGAAGLWDQLKAEGSQGTSETYQSQGVFGHFALSLPNAGILGEVYTGQNLGKYYGAIANGSSLEGVDSKGGWGQVWFQVHPQVRLNATAGTDDVSDEDVIINNRTRNQAIMGSVLYSPVDPVTIGLEVSQWETEYQDTAAVKNLRLQSSFVLNF